MKGLISFLLWIAVLPVAHGANDKTSQTRWEEDPAVLDCQPRVLRLGEPLTLRFGPGHGAEMSIWRVADQRPFFLVVQGPPADMHSLMSREEFAAAKTVTLTPDTTGFAWVYDGGNEKIFTLEGEYRIHVSEILESERGGHTCSVIFRQGAR